MSYSSEVAADSPLVYWRLGDGSGTTAADSSGNSHPATWTGTPTYVSGLLSGDSNGAVKPNSQSASVADAAWLHVSAVTVEAIVKLDNVVTGAGVVDRYGNGGAGVSSWLLYTPSSKFSFLIRDNVGDKSAASTATISTGTTYHLVGTCDGTNVRLYVNGSLAGGPTACGPLEVGTAAATIAKTVFSSVFTDGTIDEVAIYGTALSSTRIAAHYAAISPSLDATLTPTPAVSKAGATAPAMSAVNVATMAPTPASALAGAVSPGFVEIISAGTDTTNVVGGLALVGGGTVTLTRAPADVPATLVVADRFDKAVPYPVPTMVNGRPT